MAKSKVRKLQKKLNISKKKPRDGYWFRCLRTAFHFKQSDLAYYANVSNSTVSNYETGRLTVDQSVAKDLRAHLYNLIISRAEVYGPKKTQICLNRAKLDFAEYFELYDIFVVSTWATEIDRCELNDSLRWNGLSDWGDAI